MYVPHKRPCALLTYRLGAKKRREKSWEKSLTAYGTEGGSISSPGAEILPRPRSASSGPRPVQHPAKAPGEVVAVLIHPDVRRLFPESTVVLIGYNVHSAHGSAPATQSTTHARDGRPHRVQCAFRLHYPGTHIPSSRATGTPRWPLQNCDHSPVRRESITIACTIRNRCAVKTSVPSPSVVWKGFPQSF